MSESRLYTYVLIGQTETGLSDASQNLMRLIAAAYAGLNASVEVIIVGRNDIPNRDSLDLCGIKKMTHLKSGSTLPDSPGFKGALLELFSHDGIVHIYALNDAHMTGLTASLAAARQWPMFANCTKIENIKNITRPVFGGKIDELRNVSSVSCVITVRPGKEIVDANPVETELKTIELVDTLSGEYKVTLQKNAGKKNVSDASIVISGGRGMKSAENFSALFKLAEIVDGAVGASRPVVDSGWLTHEHQVGQTGSTISPNLYIACGISGSVQHVAGMSTAKCIVAINADKDAPIFSIADYGIVGDVLEILPQLTTEIEILK